MVQKDAKKEEAEAQEEKEEDVDHVKGPVNEDLYAVVKKEEKKEEEEKKCETESLPTGWEKHEGTGSLFGCNPILMVVL